MIDTTSYTVTESTELEQDHGAPIAGICVKVEVHKSDPLVAKKIESEEDYNCSGRHDDDDDAEGKLFGLIEQLPPDLHNGDLVIGGRTFVVSDTTKLESNGRTFSWWV